MSNKTLKGLGKSLDFHTLPESRAAEYIAESLANGNMEASRRMFLALTNTEKGKAIRIMRDVLDCNVVLDNLLIWFF